MNLNHNIINKISKKYIDQKIKEEESKFYAYIFFEYSHMGESIRDKRSPAYPNIIKANSMDEVYLEIFDDKNEYLLPEFILNNKDDTIIMDTAVPKEDAEFKENEEDLKTYIYDCYYGSFAFADIKIWKERAKSNQIYIDKKICDYMKVIDHTYKDFGDSDYSFEIVKFIH